MALSVLQKGCRVWLLGVKTLCVVSSERSELSDSGVVDLGGIYIGFVKPGLAPWGALG
jgi:hypothetical protein